METLKVEKKQRNGMVGKTQKKEPSDRVYIVLVVDFGLSYQYMTRCFVGFSLAFILFNRLRQKFVASFSDFEKSYQDFDLC